MKHGSLFSGIGGFDLAAEWMGWENKFHCEWNPFGQKVLHYYWPNAEQFTDITKTDFTKYEGTIDIISGGFPCQPYSSAGKRLGKEDERHLWPEMLRAIREIQPRWVVGENVRGLTNWNGGLVFNEVQSDLEAAGYEVLPFLLPACAVNAPHRRDRIWFIAHSRKLRLEQCAESRALGERQAEIRGEGSESTLQSSSKSGVRNASNSSNERLEGEQNQGEDRRTESEGVSNGRGHASRFFCSRWEEFPTKSPICTGDDGLSKRLDGITFPKWRNESIKAGGNAIVPQLALQIFKAIQQYDTENYE